MERLAMIGAALLLAAGVPALAGGAAKDREARGAAMFERIDTNRDGMISRAEWDAARAARQARARTPIDSDGDGRISAAEWQTAGRPAERFAMVDKDGDGVVTREEMQEARKAWQAQRAQ